MLTLYYTRTSFYSRFIWLTLLEKQLKFKLVALKLNGDQFAEEFIEISPFSRIPALVDGEISVIESSAILDYLEIKYPVPALLPKDPQILAKVRMVQTVTNNELLPGLMGMLIHRKDILDYQYAQKRLNNVLDFFEKLLINNTYFAGEQLTFAEIVAGNLIPYFPKFNIPLDSYPQLKRWSENLLLRKSWQEMQLSQEELINFKRRMKVMPKIIQKRRRERVKIGKNV